MNPSVFIAIGSVMVSVLTFLVTQFGMSTNQRVTYIAGLEEKILKLESRVSDLEDENLRLMRKLLASGL